MASLALASAGWLLGTAVQMHLRELPAVPALAVLGATAVLLALAAGLGWPLRRPWLRALLWLAAAAVAAGALATLRAQMRLQERLPAALEGRDLVVTGIVVQLPRTGMQGTRFLFDVESAQLQEPDGQQGVAGVPVVLPATVSLGWYRIAEPDALLLGPQTEVRAGQRWRFTVRLRQPHGPFNPGGFDVELWLFERGIGAVGSVRSRAGDEAVLVGATAGAPVERLRQNVRDAIERRLVGGSGGGEGSGRLAGVIAALAIGDQAAIERDDWDLFRVTGVAHLMSISGLHVTMFAWLAAMVVGRLWRFSERGTLWLPAPLAARWGGVALAFGYSLVAGWGVPAQRTVLMLLAVAALQSAGLRWPLHIVLLVVAAFVVAVDPWALLQPGFWLSFVAVALLAASQPVHERAADDGAAGVASAVAPARQAIAAAVRTQAVATVGLAPLSLLFFQQLSLVGFAANLVAIPLVTLLVTPLALLGVLLPPLWDAAALVLAALISFLQWLAPSGSAAVWQAAAAPAWAVAAGLLGGLVAVLPLPWALRVLALPLMLPLLAPAVPRPGPGAFELVALDVGQGTAALIRTRAHLLVYDTGAAFSPEADAGSRLVVPLLHRRGERRVDTLVLSHRDSDHTGGAAAVIAALPVRSLASSLEEGHPLLVQARAAGAAVSRCAAGQRWEWDGVRFEMLHPLATDYERAATARPNAMSCVLRVTAGADAAAATAAGAAAAPPPRPAAASVLLTGDIEAAQEAALLARSDGDALRARTLLVPHHGSRTSSTAAFIDAVAPARAVFQAGYRSRFGHPAPDVQARYEGRGIAVLRSDRCGALTLAADALGQPRCEREAARRYWHHRHYWHDGAAAAAATAAPAATAAATPAMPLDKP
ncbi:MAG: DNA internalization-related competence protein ComEC/Rec2 [Rubrivivax sp.]|nr:DNA internalization-related competence protein ComEC/Rec2 [Rubrivivax sp.]